MNPLTWLNPGRWLLVVAVIAALALGVNRWSARQQDIGYDKAVAEYTALALKATQQAREKELILQANLTKVAHEYQTEKKRRAADAVVAAGKLRDLEAALDSASAEDTSATAGADDPPIAVARECARSLVKLDEYAQSLASQTRGLQAYARDVCMMTDQP